MRDGKEISCGWWLNCKKTKNIVQIDFELKALATERVSEKYFFASMQNVTKITDERGKLNEPKNFI